MLTNSSLEGKFTCDSVRPTTGLLECKNKASRLRDLPLHEELVGYFNDVNDLKSFIANQLPEIKEFLRKKATIQRNDNLDLQAREVTVASNRANAKRKRDERMVAEEKPFLFHW